MITLAPGRTAHADLRITNAQNYPASTCDPVGIDRLKIFPPGQTSVLYISLTTTACRNASVRLLGVRTVQAGNAG